MIACTITRLLEQLRTQSDLYREPFTDEEYEALIEDMSTPNKDTHMIACTITRLLEQLRTQSDLYREPFTDEEYEALI
nr:hypothetical protein [Tanacetum cinerariifolium]